MAFPSDQQIPVQTDPDAGRIQLGWDSVASLSLLNRWGFARTFATFFVRPGRND